MKCWERLAAAWVGAIRFESTREGTAEEVVLAMKIIKMETRSVAKIGKKSLAISVALGLSYL